MQAVLRCEQCCGVSRWRKEKKQGLTNDLIQQHRFPRQAAGRLVADVGHMNVEVVVAGLVVHKQAQLAGWHAVALLHHLQAPAGCAEAAGG